jgi:vacuolar-type H+-ATPase subunit F/Vma7
LDELDELDIKKEFPNILLIPSMDEIDVVKELIKIGVALKDGSI